MANSDTFTATTTWQAIEANGADITNGTFTVFNPYAHLFTPKNSRCFMVTSIVQPSSLQINKAELL